VRWSGQSRAIQRFGAVKSKLRSPVASAARDLPLREPVRSAILPQNQPQSGECRLKGLSEARATHDGGDGARSRGNSWDTTFENDYHCMSIDEISSNLLSALPRSSGFSIRSGYQFKQ
jgi:hypothetical protein